MKVYYAEEWLHARVHAASRRSSCQLASSYLQPARGASCLTPSASATSTATSAGCLPRCL